MNRPNNSRNRNRNRRNRDRNRERVVVGHELSRRHIAKVSRRTDEAKRRMTGVWAVTFLTRGKALLPLGAAAMMVQSSWIDNEGREHIQLACFNASLTSEGVVYRPKMRHAFEKTPVAGGAGRALDPRDPEDPTCRRGDRPNGEWVRHGLDAFGARQKASENSWELAVIPKLPDFLVSVATVEELKNLAAEPSDALRASICRHFGWAEESFANMLPSFVRDKGEELLQRYALAPDSEGNTTGTYLIPIKYVKHLVPGVTRIFENFAGLMTNTTVYNYARDVVSEFPSQGIRIQNPTNAVAWFDTQRALKLIREADVADERKIEEVEVQGIEEAAVEALTEIMGIPSDSKVEVDPVQQAQDRIMELLPKLRAMIGMAGDGLTDDDLMLAMENPEEPIFVTLDKVSERFGVELMRERIAEQRPHLLVGIDDYDLLQAWRNPRAALQASLLPRMQVLRRNPKMPLEQALDFGPATFNGERVRASLFVRENWRPRGGSRPESSRREAEPVAVGISE